MRSGIGALIKSRREELGMTQEQLASLVGTNQPAVSSLETGKTMPRNLEAYTEALELTKLEVVQALLERAFDDDKVVRALGEAPDLDRAARNALITIYKQLVLTSSGLFAGGSHRNDDPPT